MLEHKDYQLSNQYAFEFERLIHYYLPYARKYYIELYIPAYDNDQFTYLPTRVISINDILTGIQQGTTYNQYNENQTGFRYYRIRNFPVWFIDSNAANTPLQITDTNIGFTQDFTIVVYKFPESECFPGLKTFVNSIFRFDLDSEQRFFEIVSEDKFSAYGKTINTIYRCNVYVSKKEFNLSENSLSYYIYNDNLHKIIPESMNNLLTRLINKLTETINKIRRSNNFIVGSIDKDQIVFIDILILMHLLNYKPKHITFYLPERFINTYQMIINNSNHLQKYNDLLSIFNDYKQRLLICENNLSLDIDINQTFNMYTDFISLSDPIQNPLGQFTIDSFNLLSDYTNDKYRFWLQLLMLMYLLDY